MTGWHITIGYNGGSETERSFEEAWACLRAAAEDLRDDTEGILAEARRLGAPETCEDGCCTLREVAEDMANRASRAVIIIDRNYDAAFIQYGDKDPEEWYQVMCLRSGDGALKNPIRRAFVRMLIEEMHRQDIDVRLGVS